MRDLEAYVYDVSYYCPGELDELRGMRRPGSAPRGESYKVGYWDPGREGLVRRPHGDGVSDASPGGAPGFRGGPAESAASPPRRVGALSPGTAAAGSVASLESLRGMSCCPTVLQRLHPQPERAPCALLGPRMSSQPLAFTLPGSPAFSALSLLGPTRASAAVAPGRYGSAVPRPSASRGASPGAGGRGSGSAAVLRLPWSGQATR
jgi:hypothetical protein